MYVRGCPTCDEGDPSYWDVTGGLQQMLRDRGVSATLIERYRSSPEPERKVAFEDLAAAIARGAPAIATLCAARPAALPGVAAQRAGSCFSVAVVGTLTTEAGRFLVARDGLVGGEDANAARFRVTPTTAGVSEDGPWTEPGSGLYAWEGSNTNIVLTMLVNAESRPD